MIKPAVSSVLTHFNCSKTVSPFLRKGQRQHRYGVSLTRHLLRSHPREPVPTTTSPRQTEHDTTSCHAERSTSHNASSKNKSMPRKSQRGPSERLLNGPISSIVFPSLKEGPSLWSLNLLGLRKDHLSGQSSDQGDSAVRLRPRRSLSPGTGYAGCRMTGAPGLLQSSVSLREGV